MGILYLDVTCLLYNQTPEYGKREEQDKYIKYTFHVSNEWSIELVCTKVKPVRILLAFAVTESSNARILEIERVSFNLSFARDRGKCLFL